MLTEDMKSRRAEEQKSRRTEEQKKNENQDYYKSRGLRILFLKPLQSGKQESFIIRDTDRIRLDDSKCSLSYCHKGTAPEVSVAGLVSILLN